MKFDKEQKYYLDDPILHEHLREEWKQGGETDEVIEHMIKKLIDFSYFANVLISIWDIELTYEREIKIYDCLEGTKDDVDYAITIYPDKFYRRR